MSPQNMACIILASGLSERFGALDKMQANLMEKPLLQHILDTVAQIEFGEVFLVSRTDIEISVTTIRNDKPETGQGHALRLGLSAAKVSGWETAMICLGDMPLVTAEYLHGMIATFEDDTAMVSISEGRKLPPAIFSRYAMNIILSGSHADGAKSVFEKLRPKTFPIPTQMALDVDTPEDLARVEAMMKARAI